MKKYFLFLLMLPCTHLFGQNPLLIPDTLGGNSINLTLQFGTHQFFDGSPTSTMGANGNILGPTLILNQGDFIDFSVTNLIGDTTTIHWHGMHVSPENDGGPHTSIAPNAIWSPSFTVMDKAATYWYHPHLHHKTNKHVTMGIAGMILVRDDEEAALNLPRTYGVDDFPLVLQTKDFDGDNQIIVDSNSDDVFMVNATVDAVLEVPAQMVRFRVLDGSSQRAFNLGLSNGQNFYQIASDGGLLSDPLETSRMLLAPGERAEIVIDFSALEGQTIYLQSFAGELPNGIYGAANPGMGAGMTLNGYNPNSLNGNTFDMLQFNVVAATVSPITTIPSALAVVATLDEGTSNITRTLTFSPTQMGPNQLNGNFLINNSAFEMDVVNITVPLNNTEIWELDNQSGMAHPFHIHDVQFYILTRNGVLPPVNERGRKDVVLVKPQETVRFIAKFEHFANPDVPYMYHCHLLPHEDGGMMGQFIVDGSTTVESAEMGQFNVFPNPSNGTVTIVSGTPIIDLKVYDLQGRLLRNWNSQFSDNRVVLTDLPSGVLLLNILTESQNISRRVVVE